MSAVADSFGVSVKKGWVRDGILRSLAREPSTLTALASALGVSKSTVNYHLANLLARGAIEIVDTRVGRGGVVSNEYSLKEGSLVILPSADEEEGELTSLEEVFDVETLLWGTASELPEGGRFEVLLYKLFLHLFKISKSEHRTLLEGYGYRAGSMLSQAVRGRNARETLRELADEMGKREIASGQVIEIRGTRTGVLVLEKCLGSTDHPGYACHFLEGFIRGIVQPKHGAGQTVERLDVDLPACCLAVGRPRHVSMDWLKEAVLHHPLKLVGGSSEEEEKEERERSPNVD